MKDSIYNYRFNINNKEYIFNTNNGGLLEVNKDGYSEEEQKYLIENKFWVNDDFDEVAYLEREINQNIKSGIDNLELTIALTNQCNFNCIYCSQNKNQRIMTKKVANDIILKIRKILSMQKFRKISIHYFGGEPLMNIPILLYLDKNIKEVSIEKNIEYSPVITTNGSLLSEEILSAVKFRSIQLTFDGFEGTHNNLRKSDSFHFNDELMLIERILRNSEAKIVFRMNICKQNKDEAIELHKFIIEKYGYDRIEINPNRMIKYHENDPFDMLTPREFAEIIFQIRVLMDKMTGRYVLPTPRGIPCKFPYGNAYAISPEGYCNFCSGSMKNGKIKFTNIDTEEKKEITFRDECRKCKCLPLCLGGCIVQHDLKAGCCTYEKYQMKQIIEHYIERIAT